MANLPEPAKYQTNLSTQMLNHQRENIRCLFFLAAAQISIFFF
jgi:hypothetical protein